MLLKSLVVGGVVSSTVIVSIEVAVLPQPSVIVQVLVIVSGQVPVDESLYVAVIAASQLSSAEPPAAIKPAQLLSVGTSSGHW